MLRLLLSFVAVGLVSHVQGMSIFPRVATGRVATSSANRGVRRLSGLNNGNLAPGTLEQIAASTDGMHFNSAATSFTTGRFMSSAERIVRANAARGGNKGQGGKNSGNVNVALLGAAWAAACLGGKYIMDGHFALKKNKVPWMPGPDGVVQADESPGHQSVTAEADEQTTYKPHQPGSSDLLKYRLPSSQILPKDFLTDRVPPSLPPYLTGNAFDSFWMANAGIGHNEDGTTQAEAVDEQSGLRTSSRALPPSWAHPW